MSGMPELMFSLVLVWVYVPVPDTATTCGAGGEVMLRVMSTVLVPLKTN
jgi:hypothetical protein